MTFDIYQLYNLDYDDARLVLEDYIDSLVEQFVQSPEGQAYAQEHPDCGFWVSFFTRSAYLYEGFTLPEMNQCSVKIVMDDLIPRKLTLGDRSDAEDAVPELVAFWQFMGREYQFVQAEAIVEYLTSIEDEFPDWMFDPARAGMAKSFFTAGTQAGFDMSTQEGLTAFQLAYNLGTLAENRSEAATDAFNQLLNKRLIGEVSGGLLPSASKSRQKPKASKKGFGGSSAGGKSKRKKK